VTYEPRKGADVSLQRRMGCKIYMHSGKGGDVGTCGDRLPIPKTQVFHFRTTHFACVPSTSFFLSTYSTNGLSYDHTLHMIKTALTESGA